MIHDHRFILFKKTTQERLKLVQLLTGEPGSLQEDDDEPTKEQLIEEIKQAVRK